MSLRRSGLSTCIQLRLHRQFFTLDCDAIFRNYCFAIAQEKIATWLYDVPEKFADRKIARIFRAFNFFCNFALLA